MLDQIKAIAEDEHLLAFLTTLGFGGLWLVAGLGNVLVVQQICVIGLLNAVAFAIYGPRVYVVLAFPRLTIFLVTPMWNVLENPLRDLSTVVTHVVLEMLSMPVLLEGYEVTVPGGRFVIEPACSGLGFFLCSGLIGADFAEFNRLGLRQMGASSCWDWPCRSWRTGSESSPSSRLETRRRWITGSSTTTCSSGGCCSAGC